MSANYTHATSAHDCRIEYTFDNRAARVEYPEGSGKSPEEFTSEPLEFKRIKHDDGSHENRAIKGEPTATMQALAAAKSFFLAAASAAETRDAEKVAASVAKAKAKAVAASTPKPKGS